MAAMLGLPLVAEAACRVRIVTSDEMRAFREAWSRVVGILVIDPVMMPARSNIQEVHAAVPEMLLMQPRGVVREAIVVAKDCYLRLRFAQDLAVDIGTPCRFEADWDLVCH